MHKLGIRMEQHVIQEKDELTPDYPLLAACYSRFGLIRLAKKEQQCVRKGGK